MLLIIFGFASYIVFSSSVAISYWQGKNFFSLTKGGFVSVLVSIFGMFSLVVDYGFVSAIGALSLVIFSDMKADGLVKYYSETRQILS